MFRKIAMAGATAAVIVGAGTTAFALSGESAATSGHAASSTSSSHKNAKNAGKHKFGALKALRHAVHGEIVTKGKAGFVKHEGIVGQVTTVSATSITVKAADGYTETFAIDKSTHVRKRAASSTSGTTTKAKAAPAKIGDVKSGDRVAVIGKEAAKSTANPTATLVLDGLKAKK